jgi:hypothetical protein
MDVGVIEILFSGLLVILATETGETLLVEVADEGI